MCPSTQLHCAHCAQENKVLCLAATPPNMQRTRIAIHHPLPRKDMLVWAECTRRGCWPSRSRDSTQVCGGERETRRHGHGRQGWLWRQWRDGCGCSMGVPIARAILDHGGGGAFLTDNAAYCLQELRHRELRNLLSCSGVGSTGAGVRWWAVESLVGRRRGWFGGCLVAGCLVAGCRWWWCQVTTSASPERVWYRLGCPTTSTRCATAASTTTADAVTSSCTCSLAHALTFRTYCFPSSHYDVKLMWTHSKPLEFILTQHWMTIAKISAYSSDRSSKQKFVAN